jgi:WD40 repeat protein
MKALTTVPADSAYASTVLFSPDSQILYLAGMRTIVELWSVFAWQRVRAVKSHVEGVNMLSVSAGGSLLSSASTDTTIKLWRFPWGWLLNALSRHKRPVMGVCRPCTASSPSDR